MNYEDFDEIFTDGDDFIGKYFGKHDHLQVVGWSGKQHNHRLYVVRCLICSSSDPELFGDGLFKSLKVNLMKGQLPCGCAKSVRYTEKQYNILCSRVAKDLGYIFMGWAGEYKSLKTKLNLQCVKHGTWQTGSIHSLVLNKSGCPSCRTDALRNSRVKPDDVMIASFFASGAFHPDTKFWRSDRKTKQSRAIFWNVYCPTCDTTSETQSDSLQLGKQPCACSRHSQKEAYINIVYDGSFPVALKFGISKSSETRVKNQNRQSLYRVENHTVFRFEDAAHCKASERECKQQLTCGILSKHEMPDGWSETTYLNNIDKIKQIYLKYGGAEVYELSHSVGRR